MATDALRQLLLERAGYRVRVCEFVAAEHTAKNVMLIATRRERSADREGWRAGPAHRGTEILLWNRTAGLEQLFLG